MQAKHLYDKLKNGNTKSQLDGAHWNYSTQGVEAEGAEVQACPQLDTLEVTDMSRHDGQ